MRSPAKSPARARCEAERMADLAFLLASRLTTVFGGEVRIDGLTRLTGGASRETWSFQAGARRLVLRRDPPGMDRPDGMAREAAAIAAAARMAVPVPHLVDAGVLETPYLITEYVAGETLARIHAIPPSAVPGLESYEPLARLRADYDALGEPLPTIEIALRWLARNRPDPVPETLVHGDFRTGNLIIDPDGLRAVLDWELVHRGDPRADLGWLCVKCWRFGSPLPAGGFGTVDALLDGYAELAGWRPEPRDVLWWQIYGTARWAVLCRQMAEAHLSGATESVELAAIGRPVCEQEHDLLLALGLPAEPIEDVALAPSSDLQGRPAATDLVAAVAHFLRDELMPATDGRLKFLARVAANVLDGVGRELVLGPGLQRR